MIREIVMYDVTKQGGTNALRWIFDDYQIYGYDIPWQEIFDLYDPLPSVLVKFIGGSLCCDHRSKGLSIS